MVGGARGGAVRSCQSMRVDDRLPLWIRAPYWDRRAVRAAMLSSQTQAASVLAAEAGRCADLHGLVATAAASLMVEGRQDLARQWLDWCARADISALSEERSKTQRFGVVWRELHRFQSDEAQGAGSKSSSSWVPWVLLGGVCHLLPGDDSETALTPGMVSLMWAHYAYLLEDNRFVGRFFAHKGDFRFVAGVLADAMERSARDIVLLMRVLEWDDASHAVLWLHRLLLSDPDAYDDGWSSGFSIGLSVGGLVRLATKTASVYCERAVRALRSCSGSDGSFVDRECVDRPVRSFDISDLDL